LIPDLAEAAEAFNPVGEARFEPDAARHAAYAPHVAVYERLLDAGRRLFAEEAS
jgi:sugar (pentulose or hexulose) kinase